MTTNIRLRHFKLIVKKRDYTEWTVFDADSFHTPPDEEILSLRRVIDPVKETLFNHDTFCVEYCANTNEPLRFSHITYSIARTMTNIPGVLFKNKMYGKDSRGRVYYRIIPDDVRLPLMLIPFRERNKNTFSTHTPPQYVIFKFKSWNTHKNEKHPIVELTQTIGDVNILSNYYEYQLFCKSLHASIQQIQNDLNRALKKTSEEEYLERILHNPKYHIEDRRKTHDVICIDPEGSHDFDDGFSISRGEKTIQYTNDSETNTETGCGLHTETQTGWNLSIYIANVALWMDAMKLWGSFSQRIATIYLPDRKRPMLPTRMSDNLCSLKEGETRFALAMDIWIPDNIVHKFKNRREKNSTETLLDTLKPEFKNVAICVRRNFRYTTPLLMEDDTYKNATIALNHLIQSNLIPKTSSFDVSDSHDVVALMMVVMNYISALFFERMGVGIFRSLRYDPSMDPSREAQKTMPYPVRRFLTGWHSSGGHYLLHSKEKQNSHDLLELRAYVHITSPIRRLVDMLNGILIQTELGLFDTTKAPETPETPETMDDNEFTLNTFLSKWLSTSSVEYINTTMRAIRKVQNNCCILQKCYVRPEYMKMDHTGYIVEKLRRNDGLFQYRVYLPDMNILCTHTSKTDESLYTTNKYQLFLFEDEITLNKKVHIQYADPNKRFNQVMKQENTTHDDTELELDRSLW